MLIQITNKCFGGCEHCMQNSTPQGGHMDFDTFRKAVGLAVRTGASVLGISGGEPSDNPQFMEFVRYANERIGFTICTNGYWVFDHRYEWFKEIGEMKNCMGIQVYTHPRYYKRHWEVYKMKSRFSSIKRCFFTTTPIENMQVLGRARTSDKAKEDFRNHRYFFSCLNPTLVARQSDSFTDYNLKSLSRSMFCKPLIDYKGDIHMSESCLCPSVASVNDPDVIIFHRMKTFSPCGKCPGYERFTKSNRPEIQKSKAILYGNKA